MVRLKAPIIWIKRWIKQSCQSEKNYLLSRGMEGQRIGVGFLNPVSEHIEGYWIQAIHKATFSQETGEIDYYQLDTARAQTIYYIPYSKKAVDDIIAKSVHTDKDGIIFTIKFASEDNPWGKHANANKEQFYL